MLWTMCGRETEEKKMSTFRLLHEERERVSPKDRLSAEVVAIISDYYSNYYRYELLSKTLHVHPIEFYMFLNEFLLP